MEKMSVTLMLMPAASPAVIAGSPSRVAGILIITFGRAAAACRRFVVAIEPCREPDPRNHSPVRPDRRVGQTRRIEHFQVLAQLVVGHEAVHRTGSQQASSLL